MRKISSGNINIRYGSILVKICETCVLLGSPGWAERFLGEKRLRSRIGNRAENCGAQGSGEKPQCAVAGALLNPVCSG